MTPIKYNPMYDPSIWTQFKRWFKRERYRRLNKLSHEQLAVIEREVEEGQD